MFSDYTLIVWILMQVKHMHLASRDGMFLRPVLGYSGVTLNNRRYCWQIRHAEKIQMIQQMVQVV